MDCSTTSSAGCSDARTRHPLLRSDSRIAPSASRRSPCEQGERFFLAHARAPLPPRKSPGAWPGLEGVVATERIREVFRGRAFGSRFTADLKGRVTLWACDTAGSAPRRRQGVYADGRDSHPVLSAALLICWLTTSPHRK
jgi:hypothetical protein